MYSVGGEWRFRRAFLSKFEFVPSPFGFELQIQKKQVRAFDNNQNK